MGLFDPEHQPLFAELDAPLDRWLRITYERLMWSYTPALRERYHALLATPQAPQPMFGTYGDELLDPHYEPAQEIDVELIERETLLEVQFS